MPDSRLQPLDIFEHNRAAWNRQATRQGEWSRPVSAEVIAAARRGEWTVHLTPSALPRDWLPDDVHGLRILCLASAGGQQAPVLSAAGADVTVFDASPAQLAQDETVARRDGLALTTVEGDMRDLSVFDAQTFDYVFHPISNLYVPDVRPVWRECFRVLRHGGRLLSSFFNPVVFVADRNADDFAQGIIRPRFRIPYADVRDLTSLEMAEKQSRGEALVFGHSLTEQIGGQLEAGFVLKGFVEDEQPNPRFVIDKFLPTFLATCAVKP
ncbi:class I SAM-dependent methyltransferase [Pandoraea pulmonicola]|uniref:Methyltransferase n=1 Tax=Pandoraea pulmonicola TaxID=93221 RepID=A0AAJ4ZCU9_PANPU|nr:class I SAM-dependent methyltransferase [Pandoraea pulmonicola]AJC20530.1 methyltransferase [Pandoraea pulmonicola]SUA91038.1 Methyltransferase domain [Pandoraea pulmonicola]